MHNARQQAILTALGIRQWIPRAAVTVSTHISTVADNKSSSATQVLWRQANDTDFSIASDSLAEPVVLVEATASVEAIGLVETSGIVVSTDQTSVVNEKVFNENLDKSTAEFLDGSLADPINDALADSVNNPINNALDDYVPTVSSVQKFRIQAVEINQWIVLINEIELQDPQLIKLWQNILIAFKKPQIIYLSWPLADGQRWQRPNGAKAALDGFLFRMGLDKRVGIMTELADAVCSDRIERLPHLSELLEQPLKKRLLWQLLQAK